ncbi:MAG: hypothetical protein FJ265_18705, partial [Planctomycetes bacterium]|nr:hypothetical protein [Planctomycetota bacterium]
MRTALAAVLCLLSSLAAQTFVVDAANGPGANFTSLPAAVAAVPDGAVLLVRAGSYAGFTTSGKGLTILGDPGVSITGGIGFANTTAQQAVTLRQLAWPSAQIATGTALVRLTNCAGPVLLERLAQPAHDNCLPGAPFGVCARATGVYATACAQLCLRDCTILCTCYLEHSDTVVESCRIEGEDPFLAYTMQHGRTALTAWGGKVQIAGSSVLQGGDGHPYGLYAAFAGNGVFADSVDLRVLGGQVLGGNNGIVPSFTIYTSVTTRLRVSPRVTLVGGFGPQVGTNVMPQLTGSGAAPGGALTATANSENGDLVVLVR